MESMQAAKGFGQFEGPWSWFHTLVVVIIARVTTRVIIVIIVIIVVVMIICVGIIVATATAGVVIGSTITIATRPAGSPTI